MKTTVSKDSTNGEATATVEKQVKDKLTQESIGLQVQKISISKIKADPKQPRKTFSKESLKTLADTIKELGLIEPITVRTSGKQFIIVVGERRYLAHKLLGLKTIECMVRDFNEKLIPEIQVIENLQRENLPPIEEAEGIAQLLQFYTAKEISQRIGRTEKFIRQRTKLIDLIPEFRAHVVDNNLTLSKAIQLANFPEDEQKEIFEGMLQQCQEFNLNYINRACDEMSFDLNKAPFDINDSELLITAGACGKCPFNSINQGALFGNDKPVCSKSSCYQIKKTKHFLAILNQAKSDGTMIIPEIWDHNIHEDENQLVITYMEENGFTVYLPDDVDIMHTPKEPTLEQLKKQYPWKNLMEKEWKEMLADKVKGYKDELKVYNQAPKDGYLKAVLLDTTNYFQKHILVKLEEEDENDQETVSSIPVSEKTMAQCTPKEQIVKIQNRETRKKELESNKLFEEVAKTICETDYINTKKALSVDEVVAFTIILLNDFTSHSPMKQKLMAAVNKSRKKNKVDVVADYKKTFKEDTLNKLIRNIILQQCHIGEINQTNNVVNAAIYGVMKQYYKEDVESIEAVYNDKKSTREKKIKARIAGLKTQVEELGV